VLFVLKLWEQIACVVVVVVVALVVKVVTVIVLMACGYFEEQYD
jgi:hypothetical protein